MSYVIHLLIFFDIYVVLALSFNLVAGYCGLLTLAHASYFAIGAYGYAITSVVLGWSIIPASCLSIGLASLLSLVVSLPAWRLRGDFFILVSLAIQVVIYSTILNWFDPNAPLGSWQNLTNGSLGIVRIPRPAILGTTLSSPMAFASFATLVAASCSFLIWRLQSSPWGRLLLAMRDDELAVLGLAKRTRRAKVKAMAIACAIAAAAGIVYASYVGYLHPSAASLDQSILILAMVLVGGLGNFRGPLVGAATLIVLPELLRTMDLPDTRAAQWRLLLYGLTLVLLVHFRPSGMAGDYRVE